LLTCIDLNGNDIRSQGCSALAQAITSCPALTDVYLNGNDVSDVGCVALAAVISKCPLLKTIYLDYNSIDIEGCLALAEVIPHCPSLTTISLNYNMFGDEGCKALSKAISKCPLLTNIKLWGCNISIDGFIFFADASLRCPIMRTIDFSVGNDACALLKNAFGNVFPIHLADLSYKNITGDEFVVLAKALPFCASQTDIILEDNSIGNEGCVALAQTINYCTSVRCLKLSWNKIGVEGCTALANALTHNRNIIYADLSCNLVGDEYGGPEALEMIESIISRNKAFIARWERRRPFLLFVEAFSVLKVGGRHRRDADRLQQLLLLVRGFLHFPDNIPDLMSDVFLQPDLVRRISTFL
jgi:Ran GTPase-activating protein (RanGAP) involved in mRNA processing and transport